jgi:hypothetical protein
MMIEKRLQQAIYSITKVKKSYVESDGINRRNVIVHKKSFAGVGQEIQNRD